MRLAVNAPGWVGPRAASIFRVSRTMDWVVPSGSSGPCFRSRCASSLITAVASSTFGKRTPSRCQNSSLPGNAGANTRSGPKSGVPRRHWLGTGEADFTWCAR